jgi:hypothetical protein
MAYVSDHARRLPNAQNLGNGGDAKVGNEFIPINETRYSDGTAQVSSPFEDINWCREAGFPPWQDLPNITVPNAKTQTVPAKARVNVLGRIVFYWEGQTYCQRLVVSVPSMGVKGWMWDRGLVIDQSKFCDDPQAKNTGSYGDCIYPQRGCKDSWSNTYDPTAEINDPSLCKYDVLECKVGPNLPYTSPDVKCPDVVYGCMDPNARNYNPKANINTGCKPSLKKKCWYSTSDKSTWVYVDQDCEDRKVCHAGTSDETYIKASQTCDPREKIICHQGTADQKTYFYFDINGKCPPRPIDTSCWNGKPYFINSSGSHEPSCPERQKSPCWLGEDGYYYQAPDGTMPNCPTRRTRSCWNGTVYENKGRFLAKCPPDTRKRGCTDRQAYNYDAGAVVNDKTCQYYPTSCSSEVRYCRNGDAVSRKNNLHCNFTSCSDGTIPQSFKWDQSKVDNLWAAAEKKAFDEVTAPLTEANWTTIKLNQQLVDNMADQIMAKAKQYFAKDSYIKKLVSAGWMSEVKWDVLNKIVIDRV